MPRGRSTRLETSAGSSRARSCVRLAGAALLAGPAVLAPSSESLAGTTDFTVQYQNYNAATPNDTIAEAGIRIRNNTGAAIPLSSIVVRYWLTKDSATSVTPVCWWWNPACSNITLTTGTVSYTGADRYVEIRFNSGAGSLSAGATTQPIDLGITFGVNVNEADDYSYGNQTTFADWSKITVHDAGSAPAGGLRGGTLPSGGGTVTAELFDDFSYPGITDPNFTSRWWVRTGGGAPGVPNAQWLSSNVSIIADPSSATNKLLRLKATTSGAGTNTSHAEVQSTDDRFRLGTYAARLNFTSTPLSGARYYADKPVETFFTISPWVNNPETDLNYSEQDFEYMPNGGWGQGNTSTLWLTSWETASHVNKLSDKVTADYAGWRTVVLQITGATISYYLDGALLFTHGATYVPETNQHLDFNLWFDEIATTQSSARTYHEDADWVYFAKDTILSPAAVEARVAAFRASSVVLKDTVP